jgi:hypothetical protein
MAPRISGHDSANGLFGPIIGKSVKSKMTTLRHIRVFLSSPGDVSAERDIARRIIKDDLPYDPFLRSQVTLEIVSWDDPSSPTPMLATLYTAGSG